MKKEKNEIFIKKEIDSDLTIKNNAISFFERINKLEHDEILINFEGSEYISRSFAQAYLSQKKSSPKKIKEYNIPENIESILKIVENAPKIDIKKIVQF